MLFRIFLNYIVERRERSMHILLNAESCSLLKMVALIFYKGGEVVEKWGQKAKDKLGNSIIAPFIFVMVVVLSNWILKRIFSDQKASLYSSTNRLLAYRLK